MSDTDIKIKMEEDTDSNTDIEVEGCESPTDIRGEVKYECDNMVLSESSDDEDIDIGQSDSDTTDVDLPDVSTEVETKTEDRSSENGESDHSNVHPRETSSAESSTAVTTTRKCLRENRHKRDSKLSNKRCADRDALDQYIEDKHTNITMDTDSDTMDTDNPSQQVTEVNDDSSSLLDDKSMSSQTFTCSYEACSYKTDTFSKLKQHTKKNHSDNLAKDKIHTCFYCDFTSIYTGHLKNHYKSRHADLSEYMCSEAKCKYTSAVMSEFLAHIDDHVALVKCTYCNYQASCPSRLKLHILKHTNPKPAKPSKDPGPPLLCSVCAFPAKTKRHLRSHMIKHSTDRPFHCEICPYTAAYSGHLARHRRLHTDEPKRFKCTYPDCAFATHYKNALQIHIRQHTGEMPFSCTLCDRKTKCQSDLRIHMITHGIGRNTFKCEECDYTTMRENNFILHRKKHSGITELCTLCGFTTIYPERLRRHYVKYHDENSPFKCPICNITHSTAKMLACHIKRHDGYQCQQCDFKGTRHVDLMKHTEEHKRDGPQLCSKCGFTTTSPVIFRKHVNSRCGADSLKCREEGCMYEATTKTKLKSHMRENHPQVSLDSNFSCSLCEYTTDHKVSLTKHMLKHSNEKPFQCSYCDYGCVLKYTLRRHIVKNHDISHDDAKKLSVLFCPDCEFSCVKKSALENHIETTHSLSDSD